MFIFFCLSLSFDSFSAGMRGEQPTTGVTPKLLGLLRNMKTIWADKIPVKSYEVQKNQISLGAKRIGTTWELNPATGKITQVVPIAPNEMKNNFLHQMKFDFFCTS